MAPVREQPERELTPHRTKCIAQGIGQHQRLRQRPEPDLVEQREIVAHERRTDRWQVKRDQQPKEQQQGD